MAAAAAAAAAAVAAAHAAAAAALRRRRARALAGAAPLAAAGHAGGRGGRPQKGNWEALSLLKARLPTLRWAAAAAPAAAAAAAAAHAAAAIEKGAIRRGRRRRRVVEARARVVATGPLAVLSTSIAAANTAANPSSASGARLHGGASRVGESAKGGRNRQTTPPKIVNASLKQRKNVGERGLLSCHKGGSFTTCPRPTHGTPCTDAPSPRRCCPAPASGAPASAAPRGRARARAQGARQAV